MWEHIRRFRNPQARKGSVWIGKGCDSISMARNRILALFFLLLVAADVSNASVLWKLRKLIDSDPKDITNGAQSVSPSPSPVSGNGTSDPHAPHNSSWKNPEPINKDKTKTNPELTNEKNCVGVLHPCLDLKLSLCVISNPNDASGSLSIVVQNEGNSRFNGSLTAGSVWKAVDVAEHNSYMVNISSSEKITSVRIQSTNGEMCNIYTSPLESEGNFFVQIPSFDQLATPINAAYFSILTVLVIGGTWACCMWRKKRQHGRIGYHELEMAQPDSASAPNIIVESAQSWYQDWDDGWDEENAIKPSGGLRVGSVSANGLTARSANKDGWENNWDD